MLTNAFKPYCACVDSIQAWFTDSSSCFNKYFINCNIGLHEHWPSKQTLINPPIYIQIFPTKWRTVPVCALPRHHSLEAGPPLSRWYWWQSSTSPSRVSSKPSSHSSGQALTGWGNNSIFFLNKCILEFQQTFFMPILSISTTHN